MNTNKFKIYILFPVLFLAGVAGIIFGISELHSISFVLDLENRYEVFRGILMIVGGFALLKWALEIKELVE